ncbi:hypothetical protein C8J57DRAFT_1231626 [Mycena rebaudengoi]|nr:hypothetical protein C8J57DRAFT_1231626 [Mycena rebaudengoi]
MSVVQIFDSGNTFLPSVFDVDEQELIDRFPPLSGSQPEATRLRADTWAPTPTLCVGVLLHAQMVLHAASSGCWRTAARGRRTSAVACPSRTIEPPTQPAQTPRTQRAGLKSRFARRVQTHATRTRSAAAISRTCCVSARAPRALFADAAGRVRYGARPAAYVGVDVGCGRLGPELRAIGAPAHQPWPRTGSHACGVLVALTAP